MTSVFSVFSCSVLFAGIRSLDSILRAKKIEQ